MNKMRIPQIVILLIFALLIIEADQDSDRIKPEELHYRDVPKFTIQPKPLMYTMKDLDAVFHCRVTPADHVTVICNDEKFTIGPNSKLSVNRFNSAGEPDPNGPTWDIHFEIMNKMVIAGFKDYQCHCQAWNYIKELEKHRFVYSQPSIIKEAVLGQEFVMEPVSANLTVGSSLTLSCEPPKSIPKPDVFWMKDGQRIGHDNQYGIFINQYNHLIIENVRPIDSGNYTCEASLFDKVSRTSNARVVIISNDGIIEPVQPDSTKDRLPITSKIPTPTDETFNENSRSRLSDLTRRDIALFAGLFCAGTAVFIFIGLALLIISRRANSSMPEKRINNGNVHSAQRSLFIDANNCSGPDLKSQVPFVNSYNNNVQYPGGPAPPPPQNSSTAQYQVQSGQSNYLPSYQHPATYINCPKQVVNEVVYQPQNFHINNPTNYSGCLPLTPKQTINVNKGLAVNNSSAPSTNSTMLMNSSMQSKTTVGRGNQQLDDFVQQQHHHQRMYNQNYSLSAGSSGSNASNTNIQVYPAYNNNPGVQHQHQTPSSYVTTSGTSASTEHSHYQEPNFQQLQHSPNLLADLQNKSPTYVYDSVVLEHNYEDPNSRKSNVDVPPPPISL